MHLTVPGAVAHLFYVQRALNQGGVDRAWQSPDFHQELADWKVLALQAESRPRHLAEIVRQEPTHLGFVTRRDSEREAYGSTRPGQVRIWSGDFLGPRHCQ